ncbi:hypothetical protein HDU76_003037, partial [Blyttiomyces sp. JEL0837]
IESYEDEEDKGENALPWRHICIIGNAQKRADAIRSHNTWGAKFDSFWYVWGDDFQTPIKDTPSRINLIRSEDKKTWAQGVDYLLTVARATFDCEYIFTHDDDLSFRSTFINEKKPLYAILTDILSRYQPAVAGFPWHVGDQSFPTMAGLASHFGNREVAPLTGFDSGMVLYHKSVVDLFIPYSPRGEGGFYGNWSLCAHFLNLFAPLTFESSAIRINALSYSNLISFDNVPQKKRKPAIIDNKGLVVHPESRHPYEYHLNTPYRRFLSNGLLNRYQKWGKDLALYDVTWDVYPINNGKQTEAIISRPGGHRNFNKWDILNKIASFYDLSHPILSRNGWLKSQFTESELSSYMEQRSRMGSDFEILIHIFAMNRRKSFDRLWFSINTANKINRKVSLVIHLDHDESFRRKNQEMLLAHIRSLVSPHGSVTLSINARQKGLKNNIMDAWTPLSRKEYAIFLEDDISVSPHFLEYSEQMIARYLHPRGSPGHSSHCIGISLYNQRYDEVNERTWSIDTGPHFTPYILQQPQSWGAIYSPDGWSEFVKWYTGHLVHFDPLIPNSYTNRWLAVKSWKKYLIRYMYAKGKFLIYPNFPEGMSITTNHLEVGTNDKLQGSGLKTMASKFTVPLLNLGSWMDGKTKGSSRGVDYFYQSIAVSRDNGVFMNLTGGRGFEIAREESIRYPTESSSTDTTDLSDENSGKVGDVIRVLAPGAQLRPSYHLPPMNHLPIVNAHFRHAKALNHLRFGIQAATFDKCTMVLNVHERPSALIERLRFYESLKLLDSIIVVWNIVNVSPPNIAPPEPQATQALQPRSKARRRKRGNKSNIYSFSIPVHVMRQKQSSPNNRYKPFSQIKTDCIIAMEDSWNMPHEHLEFAVKLFQGHFYNHLIGFSHQGLTHRIVDEDTWSVTKDASKGVSIMMPAGSVFHRKYLGMYTTLPKTARDIAVNKTECAEILFNMMVANVTQSGPVVVRRTAEAVDLSNLWQEKETQAAQGRCIGEYVRGLFKGTNPLRYTLSTFEGLTETGVTPNLKTLRVSDNHVRAQSLQTHNDERVSVAEDVKVKEDNVAAEGEVAKEVVTEEERVTEVVAEEVGTDSVAEESSHDGQVVEESLKEEPADGRRDDEAGTSEEGPREEGIGEQREKERNDGQESLRQEGTDERSDNEARDENEAAVEGSSSEEGDGEKGHVME